MTQLVYNPSARSKLAPASRDYNSNWMTAVHMLQDDTFIGSDNALNLFVTKKQDLSQEDTIRMIPYGSFHLGQLVNRIRPGSIMMHKSDEEAVAKPELLYCTVSGSIGMVASLSKDVYDLLHHIQNNLEHHVKASGKLSWSKFRSFKNSSRVHESQNFIDGEWVDEFTRLSVHDQTKILQDYDLCRFGSLQDVTMLIEELGRLA